MSRCRLLRTHAPGPLTQASYAFARCRAGLDCAACHWARQCAIAAGSRCCAAVGTGGLLGFSFTSETAPRRRIAPQALARFASRVRQLTRRQSGRNLEQTIAQRLDLASHLAADAAHRGELVARQPDQLLH